MSPSKHGVILGIYVRFRGVNVGKYIKYASPMDPSLNQATVRFQQRGTDLPQWLTWALTQNEKLILTVNPRYHPRTVELEDVPLLKTTYTLYIYIYIYTYIIFKFDYQLEMFILSFLWGYLPSEKNTEIEVTVNQTYLTVFPEFPPSLWKNHAAFLFLQARSFGRTRAGIYPPTEPGLKGSMIHKNSRNLTELIPRIAIFKRKLPFQNHHFWVSSR